MTGSSQLFSRPTHSPTPIIIIPRLASRRSHGQLEGIMDQLLCWHDNRIFDMKPYIYNCDLFSFGYSLSLTNRVRLRILTVILPLSPQVRGAVCVPGDRWRVSLRHEHRVQVAAPPPPQRPLVAQNQGRPPYPRRPHALGMPRRLLHFRLQDVKTLRFS